MFFEKLILKVGKRKLRYVADSIYKKLFRSKEGFFCGCFLLSISALDKLLDQMGIYATWLSSIAYLQKQLCIFIFFNATFNFCDYTFSYCLKPSGMCLHIYSLPLSAFLKYQTSGFYCT